MVHETTERFNADSPRPGGTKPGGVGRSIVDKGAGAVTGEVREVTGVTAGTGPTGPSQHQRVPCRPAREGTRGRGTARGLSQVALLLLSIPVAFLKCGDAYVRLQNESRMSI